MIMSVAIGLGGWERQALPPCLPGMHSIVWDSNWSWRCLQCPAAWNASLNERGAIGMATRGEYLESLSCR